MIPEVIPVQEEIKEPAVNIDPTQNFKHFEATLELSKQTQAFQRMVPMKE